MTSEIPTAELGLPTEGPLPWAEVAQAFSQTDAPEIFDPEGLGGPNTHIDHFGPGQTFSHTIGEQASYEGDLFLGEEAAISVAELNAFVGQDNSTAGVLLKMAELNGQGVERTEVVASQEDLGDGHFSESSSAKVTRYAAGVVPPAAVTLNIEDAGNGLGIVVRTDVTPLDPRASGRLGTGAPSSMQNDAYNQAARAEVGLFPIDHPALTMFTPSPMDILRESLGAIIRRGPNRRTGGERSGDSPISRSNNGMGPQLVSRRIR